MLLYQALSCNIKALYEDPEISVYINMTPKELSPAAISRVEYWMKKILSYINRLPNVIQRDAPIAFPSGLAKVIRKYGYFTDQNISDAYFLFRKMMKNLIRYYSSKKNNLVITAQNVDDSLISASAIESDVFHQYFPLIKATRSLPERSVFKRSTSRCKANLYKVTSKK